MSHQRPEDRARFIDEVREKQRNIVFPRYGAERAQCGLVSLEGIARSDGYPEDWCVNHRTKEAAWKAAAG
jgi:hypothetical protein